MKRRSPVMKKVEVGAPVNPYRKMVSFLTATKTEILVEKYSNNFIISISIIFKYFTASSPS